MTEAILTPELVRFLQDQKDKEEIKDCLLRYTRGVDRADKALMASAYHADSWDEHGVTEGNGNDFSDWAIGWHNGAQTQHQHIINNHTIELDGDTAHGETYYTFWGDNREGPPTLAFGRYIDRYEKRDGKWGIAHRVCINQIVCEVTKTRMSDEAAAITHSTGPNRRDKTDLSYDRPLVKSHA
jgi:ketosteroid isomerase-like protein